MGGVGAWLVGVGVGGWCVDVGVRAGRRVGGHRRAVVEDECGVVGGGLSCGTAPVRRGRASRNGRWWGGRVGHANARARGGARRMRVTACVGMGDRGSVCSWMSVGFFLRETRHIRHHHFSVRG